MLIIFIVSVCIIVYGYLVYPILLAKFADKYGRNTETVEQFPDVAIVIAAYNEQDCIAARVANLQSLNYPGKLTFYVGSDGSQDKTNDILEAIEEPRLKLFLFENNRGKISVLNDIFSQIPEPIVVLSDANTEFADDTVQQLVSQFSDEVGAVCGKLTLTDSENNQNQDGLYWRYENFLKAQESKLGALLGANGAIYAIRRDLYQTLPTDTIVDDFVIAMNVKRQGFKVVYWPLAQAFEEVAPSVSDEYVRRVRIGLGNYKALLACRWALSLNNGWLAWCFWSHKVVRWFIPHLLIAAFVSNLFLLSNSFFQFTFLLQSCLYLACYWGYQNIKHGQKVPKLLATLTLFVAMNVALFKGFIRFCQGEKQGSWQRTARGSD